MAPLPRYLGVSRHIRSFRELSPDTETLQPDTGDMSATVSFCRTPLILSIVMVMRGAYSAPAWCLGGISPAANDQYDHRPPCLNLGNSSSICLGNHGVKSRVSCSIVPNGTIKQTVSNCVTRTTSRYMQYAKTLRKLHGRASTWLFESHRSLDA